MDKLGDISYFIKPKHLVALFGIDSLIYFVSFMITNVLTHHILPNNH
jgi:hypothetical protein